jgi:hypothetical protein
MAGLTVAIGVAVAIGAGVAGCPVTVRAGAGVEVVAGAFFGAQLESSAARPRAQTMGRCERYFMAAHPTLILFILYIETTRL